MKNLDYKRMNHYVSPEKQHSGLFRKTNYLLMHLLVMLLSLPLISFAQSPEVKNAFRLIDIEKPSKGISTLEGLASKEDNSSMQYYLGLGYLRTGNKEKALAAFEKGISLSEKDGLNHAGKGHIKLLEKNTAEATIHIQKALSVSREKDANVLKAVGEAYLVDSKYLLDALRVLNKAKAINGSDAEIHMLLGDAYLLQNNGGESVSSYERASRVDAKQGKPHYKVAMMYDRSKNYDMVFESLNKAVSVDSEYAPAYKKLGELYYVRKEADKAVDVYEKYLAITENPGQAKYQYAFFLFMAKKYDKANAIFKEVINSPNASPTALKYYAYSLIEQEKNDEAKKILQKYFSTAKPEDLQPSDYAYYGKLLLELKEDSLANENFAKSLVLDSTQQDVMQLHGNTFMKRRKFDKAVETFKTLISSRKQPLLQDLWSLGQAYYLSQQYIQADSVLSMLIEKQTPANAHIAVVRFAAGAKANVDANMSKGLAKPMYEILLEKALVAPDKYKKELIEAYDYLGAYYIHKEENVMKAKTYYEKILLLDPSNPTAKEFMKTLNSPAQKGR
jgi:tetratricopeptide (TPR) repeat protein